MAAVFAQFEQVPALFVVAVEVHIHFLFLLPPPLNLPLQLIQHQNNPILVQPKILFTSLS